ncbi:MAG: hypothetical protein WCX17_02340 [Parcubacteria group bacterium]|jgi:hypothetical protein
MPKTSRIKYLLGLIILIFPAVVLAATEHPLVDILTKILSWLLGIFGSLGLIGFVVSGILYLTAAGDQERIERAKKSFTYSILGVLIGLMGIIIIKVIEARLSGQ